MLGCLGERVNTGPERLQSDGKGLTESKTHINSQIDILKNVKVIKGEEEGKKGRRGGQKRESSTVKRESQSRGTQEAANNDEVP